MELTVALGGTRSLIGRMGRRVALYRITARSRYSDRRKGRTRVLLRASALYAVYVRHHSQTITLEISIQGEVNAATNEIDNCLRKVSRTRARSRAWSRA